MCWKCFLLTSQVIFLCLQVISFVPASCYLSVSCAGKEEELFSCTHLSCVGSQWTHGNKKRSGQHIFMAVFAQMDLFEANGFSRAIWRASPECIALYLNIADCWCNSFFKCPIYVMICAGGGSLQAVFFLQIPVVLIIRSIGVVQIFRHGKRHSFLPWEFYSFSRRLQA